MIGFGARFPQSWGRIVRPEPTDCSPPGLPDPPLRRRSIRILLILLTRALVPQPPPTPQEFGQVLSHTDLPPPLENLPQGEG